MKAGGNERVGKLQSGGTRERAVKTAKRAVGKRPSERSSLSTRTRLSPSLCLAKIESQRWRGLGRSMKKKDLITLLAGLAVVVFLAVFFMRGDQLQHLIQTIERGTPIFLLAGLAFQLGKYFTQGLSFTWCFKAAGTSMPIGENVILVFQTFFMDTIIPSFNISGTSLVIEAATKRGIESGRATGAALLRQVSISAAFVIIMIAGFAILLVMGKLETGWLILGIGAVVAVGALVTAMALAALHPQLLLKLVAPVERIIDKVLARLHRHGIDTSVKKLVDTYSSSAKNMVRNASSIVIELAWAVLANVCEIACFAFVGLAFGLDDFTAVICIYVVVTLAAMASPIPQGVGVVEAAAVVAFTIFGIEQATGLAVVMVYRVICFWLPFILGAILMRKVSDASEKK